MIAHISLKINYMAAKTYSKANTSKLQKTTSHKAFTNKGLGLMKKGGKNPAVKKMSKGK